MFLRTILKAIALLATMISAEAVAGPADFSSPQPVEITGYDGHAMEPFLSRDGKHLFFNNLNDPSVQTDIHFARRVSDLKFKYLGRLPGVNSGMLDGVPSMDDEGYLYFVSPRSYDDTRNTIWKGWFVGGEVIEVGQIRGTVSRDKNRWLNMDAEISADGRSLYFTENQWKRGKNGGPKTSDIYVARKNSTGAFIRQPDSEAIFENINTKLLEFAPATSRDELTLYFTRLDPKKVKRKINEAFGLYVATRTDIRSAFGVPRRISTINGYVEAVTLAPDDCSIYFHKRTGEQFRIHQARKLDCGT